MFPALGKYYSSSILDILGELSAVSKHSSKEIDSGRLEIVSGYLEVDFEYLQMDSKDGLGL